MPACPVEVLLYLFVANNKHNAVPVAYSGLCLESFAFYLKVLLCMKKVRLMF